jgi:5-methylcytosine-specific restriction protein A
MTRAAIRPSDRFRIFQRDGFCCRYCGKAPGETELQIDHLIPHAKGGDNSYLNLITSCRLCNAGKGQNAAERVPIPMDAIERTKEYADRLKSITKETNEYIRAELDDCDAICNVICKVAYVGKSEVRTSEITCVRKLRDEFGIDAVVGWITAFAMKDIQMRHFTKWMYGCAKHERGE